MLTLLRESLLFVGSNRIEKIHGSLIGRAKIGDQIKGAFFPEMADLLSGPDEKKDKPPQWVERRNARERRRVESCRPHRESHQEIVQSQDFTSSTSMDWRRYCDRPTHLRSWRRYCDRPTHLRAWRRYCDRPTHLRSWSRTVSGRKQSLGAR
ncbi:hypothetical protein TNIN_201031 [Trichonephila inaurata madagascariensis]|uniref:Uncharacterized protein n=1 Tax=Trichonephila inaurata madagascariensis TaxID=2747483 RepID=A0A8X6J997_9ARAC|nr:hypothetical protein TNIN_201031 [Trichonephila inaurata madagascariensis]